MKFQTIAYFALLLSTINVLPEGATIELLQDSSVSLKRSETNPTYFHNSLGKNSLAVSLNHLESLIAS
jgi:hypothetical protein